MNTNSWVRFGSLVAVAVCLSSPTYSSADTFAIDSFDYPNGELAGQNGGVGFGGGWSANTANTQVVGGMLQITGNNNALATRTFDAPFTSASDFFVSFEFTASGATTNNDFLSLFFNNFNGPNIGLKADEGGGGTNDFFVRTSGTNGVYAGGDAVAAGTVRLVGRLSTDGPAANSNFDQFDLFVLGLDDTSLGTPAATFLGDSGFSQFVNFGFRGANLDAGDSFLIDNLTFGTNAADVLPQTAAIPEPTSLAIFGLATLAGGVYLRRRKRVPA